MNYTAKKMSKIIDELVSFFFSVGSDGIHMDLQKLSDGYVLHLRSRYEAQEQKKIDDLFRFFQNVERNEGLEEIFWQLAGVSSTGHDSEIHLIGQMVDHADIRVQDGQVDLTLYKFMDKT